PPLGLDGHGPHLDRALDHQRDAARAWARRRSDPSRALGLPRRHGPAIANAPIDGRWRELELGEAQPARWTGGRHRARGRVAPLWPGHYVSARRALDRKAGHRRHADELPALAGSG